jgi:AAA domain
MSGEGRRKLHDEVHGDGGANNGAGRQSDRYAGRILDVGEMLAQPEEPIPWRCEDLAADGYLTVLAGRGGEGKSWLALALARAVLRAEGRRQASGALRVERSSSTPRTARSSRSAGSAPPRSRLASPCSRSTQAA